jgi:hypothetical protein
MREYKQDLLLGDELKGTFGLLGLSEQCHSSEEQGKTDIRHDGPNPTNTADGSGCRWYSSAGLDWTGLA